MITLEIPRVPPSINDMIRCHWRHRHRTNALWQEEIWMALVGKRPKEPYQKAHVSILRQSRGRLDPDNLVGSVKPVLDALRYAKVLVDDTPDHIELVVTQSRGLALTRIHIQPL